jgi:Arc/MetJ-type ribon-helix-helix transcriptional regulator
VGNVTSFTIDSKSRDALDELRQTLNASSNAEVIRRALTLLQLAARTTDNDGQLILREKNGSEREIIMG